MNVEIWSDVVCPWCYIGKRRFERALERFSHADEVDVRWRSFQLDPSAPRRDDTDMASHLARKYGISRAGALARQAQVTATAAIEGLDYHLELTGRANTFDAHRLLHLAADRGMQDQLKELLMRAHLCEGEHVGEKAALQRLAAEIGLDPAEVAEVLRTDAYADEVRADQRRAQELGVHGVPFFLIDGRYAVPGAQDGRRLGQLLDRAWLDGHADKAAAATGSGGAGEDTTPTGWPRRGFRGPNLEVNEQKVQD